jgi:hypothetical protein
MQLRSNSGSYDRVIHIWTRNTFSRSTPSMKNYASHFANGDSLIVRVMPGQAEISMVLDADQIKTNK